jgi:hypothetical protein
MPTPFISRTDLTDYLGTDVTTDDGALIAVDAACDIVRTLTEQDFNSVTGDTVKLDGTGTDALLLPQVPVSAAGTVVVNGGTLSATLDYTCTSDGVLIRTDGTATLSTWSQGWGPTAFWPQGRQNISVTYDHGYSGGTVPADIRVVALMIASRMTVQGLDSQRQVGQANVKYAVGASDLSANELRICRKYKRAL